MYIIIGVEYLPNLQLNSTLNQSDKKNGKTKLVDWQLILLHIYMYIIIGVEYAHNLQLKLTLNQSDEKISKTKPVD